MPMVFWIYIQKDKALNINKGQTLVTVHQATITHYTNMINVTALKVNANIILESSKYILK